MTAKVHVALRGDRAGRLRPREDHGRGQAGKTSPKRSPRRRSGQLLGSASAEPASKPGDVPVSTSPAGLLAPGADDKIRDKLAAAGFAADGKSTKEAMRRFQQANDLPATGSPDHETVKKLGLDPNDIFRAATVKD